MNGFVLINKPCGVTSFSVTGKVRRALSVDKAGHAGTLDPIATGVLPVMVGRATKLIDILPDEKKTYLAGFMLGMTTDTLDCEGDVLTEQPVNVTKEQIKSAIAHFTGKIDQVPPMYSALSKNGVKLYQLARKGIEVERKARSITIFSNELVSYDENTNIVFMDYYVTDTQYKNKEKDGTSYYLVNAKTGKKEKAESKEGLAKYLTGKNAKLKDALTKEHKPRRWWKPDRRWRFIIRQKKVRMAIM